MDGIWQPGNDTGPQPAFFRIPGRRAVHVQAGWWTPKVFRGMGLGELINQRPLARCGVHQHGVNTDPDVHVGTFDDSDLCRRCHHSVPETHRGELFEHPQAGGDELSR